MRPGGLLLTVDAGGSEIRASLVDQAGAIVASVAQPAVLEIDAPPIGRRYVPELLWDGAARAVATLLATTRTPPDTVAAVSATGQRLACAFLDERGDTLYVGPNLDARGVTAAWEVDEAAGGRLYERTGRGMALLFAPARLLWFRDNAPRTFARVRWVLGLGDWLAFRLTGVAAADATSMVELLGQDVRTGQPLADLWTQLGLDPAWLPELGEPGRLLGGVTPDAAAATGLRPGTPVALTPPDSLCALVGSGAWPPGATLVLAGSSMPVLVATPSPRADVEGRCWTGPHPIRGLGVVESNGGPSGFGWSEVVESVVGAAAGLRGDAAYARAEALAAAAPPGSRGAVAYCGGAGLMHATRPPGLLARMHAVLWPAAVLEPQLGAPELLRAVLEATAHTARVNVEQAEAVAGPGARELVVAGGMTRSALLRQMMADVMRRPVRVPASRDATATGAACCASVTAGTATDLQQAAGQMSSTVTDREPDASVAGAYGEAHRVWRSLYTKIDGSWV